LPEAEEGVPEKMEESPGCRGIHYRHHSTKKYDLGEESGQSVFCSHGPTRRYGDACWLLQRVTKTPSRAMTAKNRSTALFSQVILLSTMVAVMNATATITFFHLFRHIFFSFKALW